MHNVLVFPGGTETGLEVHRSLCRCKEIRLFSAADERSSHAPYVFSRHLFVPNIEDPTWIRRLNDIAETHEIDFVYPAYDDVMVALAQNAGDLKASVICSPLETCLTTRSKGRTYDLFSKDLPVPHRYNHPDEIARYPVFVKPDKGQGSQDTYVVEDRVHLEYLLAQQRKASTKYLVLEYLPGEEYTVDCFSDRATGLLYVGGRKRVRTRSGIAMNSYSVRDPVFVEFAEIIAGKLDFYGAWFFQVKRDVNGRCKLLEVAPRIGGTSGVHRVQGVNFPLLSIYEHLRVPIEIMFNDFDVEIDRALTNRYRHRLQYSSVYVDLDDTLIVNGKVNVDLISLLYQCVNQEIRIVLITKHQGDLERTLEAYRLTSLFDDVIRLAPSACKAEHIRERDAIFIDDSFSERREVKKRLGIPVLDCSMVELLLDHRL